MDEPAAAWLWTLGFMPSRTEFDIGVRAREALPPAKYRCGIERGGYFGREMLGGDDDERARLS
jgi:hypothetical protein